MANPLEGVRVLDLAQAISGPLVGRMMADLGADVVKVEWPRGDITNLFGARIGGVSGLFTQMNAGKRGVGIDRSVESGRQLVSSLAIRSDVVIENFRPGVLDRAGLGYEGLSSDNPRLVMLSISGFGQTGPDNNRQAFAPSIHAESGLLSRQSTFDGRPPVELALSLADSLAALHGTVAILSALLLREHIGTGQHIDLSMLEAMVATDDYTHHAIDKSDLYPARGSIWEAAGGPILIAMDEKSLWVRVSQYAGLADPGRGLRLGEKVAARAKAINNWVKSFDERDELLRALEAANLPWAELRTSETVLEAPSLLARGVVAKVPDHAGGMRGVIRMPYRFSAAESCVRAEAPERGQHNVEVLKDWLGLSDEDIDRLRVAGALGTAREVGQIGANPRRTQPQPEPIGSLHAQFSSE